MLPRKFEKVSQSLKYDSNFFLVHKYINIYIAIWTPTLITLPSWRCACRVTIQLAVFLLIVQKMIIYLNKAITMLEFRYVIMCDGGGGGA